MNDAQRDLDTVLTKISVKFFAPMYVGSLMAMSNSPTRGHPKFPQAGRPDYDDTGVMAMRAAASLSR